jgi:hypothetical protein
MWPFSAFRDFKKKRERDAQVRERDRLVKAVNDGIDSGVEGAYSSALCDLCRHADDPEMPGIARNILDRIENKKDRKSALHTSIYLMNCMHNEDVLEAVTAKVFQISAGADRNDQLFMASLAMAGNLIAVEGGRYTELEERGARLWRETVDRLAKTPQGIQYAFAAASNAALSHRDRGGRVEYPLLRTEAVDTWYKMVTELAKTDAAAAYAEAARVADGYQNFGEEARPFRSKATEALKKLSVGN